MADIKYIEDNIEVFKALAEQGDADGQNKIGFCYNNAIAGFERNDEEAVKWYRKAAEQGLAKAQSNLGYCYQEGQGVEQSSELAVEWYTKAAEQGNAIAQYKLGWCYSDGDGIKRDQKKAVEWFAKAAEQGHAGAQLDLGYCYEFGKGIRKDVRKAVEWYEKSALQGNRIAQANLGCCFERGDGVEQNYEKAAEWYQRSAEQGNGRAMNNLGLLYERGFGVAKDYTKALEWYRKAADAGEVYGLHNVGLCYENGWGTARSLKDAELWYTKAIEKGLKSTKKDLKRVKEQREKEEFLKSINFSTHQKVGGVIFARVIPFGKNYIVKRKGLWGIVNKKGEEVLPIEYTRVHWFDGGHAGIQKDTLWGLVNNNGEMTIEPQYKILHYLSQYDACEVEDEDHCFVVDSHNNIIMKKEDCVVTFDSGKLVVRSKAGWQLFNLDGTPFSNVHRHICGYYDIFMGYDGDAGETLIKSNGEEVKLPKYEIGLFVDNITQFRYQDKYGIIDRDGNIVVPNKYDYIILGSGVIAVNEGNKTKDHDSHFYAHPFCGEWFFWNYNFEPITPYRYDDMKSETINDGKAWFAKRNGTWYRIIPEGEMLFAADDKEFKRKKAAFEKRHNEKHSKDELGVLYDPNFKEDGRKLFVRACDGKYIRHFYLTPYLPMSTDELKAHWKIGDSFVNKYGQDMPNPHAFKMPKQKKKRFVFRLSQTLMGYDEKKLMSLFVDLGKHFGFEQRQIIDLYVIFQTKRKRVILCDLLLRKLKRNRNYKMEFDDLVPMSIEIDNWDKKEGR